MIKTMLAFVAAATLMSPTVSRANGGLPDFKRRWYHNRSKLDVRPVCWSLRNHPEEWKIGVDRATHNPSGHQFWIADGRGLYGLHKATCSCTSHCQNFSFVGQFQFHSALNAWRKRTQIDDQFAKHFVH